MPSKILSSVFTMLKAGGLVLVIRLLAVLVQFGFIWYINNSLGDNIYGQFVIFLMVTQLIGSISNLGLGTYLVKYIGANYQSKNISPNPLLYLTLVCTLLVSVIVTLLTFLCLIT